MAESLCPAKKQETLDKVPPVMPVLHPDGHEPDQEVEMDSFIIVDKDEGHNMEGKQNGAENVCLDSLEVSLTLLL
jgi:hypothetical protein